MKCRLLVDIGADVTTIEERERDLLKFRPINGGRSVEAYFPAGTIREIPMAWFFVDRGCAVPADDECEKASKPTTPEQRRRLESQYLADVAGVHDNGDRELFFAGVITGYQVVDGKKVYAPGPKWADYMDAKAAATDGDDA